MIEAQLSPTHEPVLGLYLHVAYLNVMSSYEAKVGHGEIAPSVIGVLALLATRPGLSQADLARLVGLERATVGAQVARAISSGFVRRDPARHDGRSYSLFITARGEAMLEKLRQRIPPHERAACARLNAAERAQLRGLLDKLVYG